MATFPLTTLGPTISDGGISAPPLSDIVASLQASFRNIYGQDVYLGADTQDGQLLAVIAAAIADSNSACISVFNQFSPATAVGSGLSSVVKINGIARAVSTRSTVDLLIGGTPGTVITAGVAGDANGNSWNINETVTIPPGGAIVVGATASVDGDIDAAVGTITTINTPTLGWATVSNPNPANPGAAVETDAQLRVRQAQSVALPALTVLDATLAAIKAVPGVTEAIVYENDTNMTDGNGLPAHSIAAVVAGGDPAAIATAIATKKTPGCFTYGTTTINVTDNAGVTHAISFFVPMNVPIAVKVSLRPQTGYTGAIGLKLQQAVVDYINALGIGQDVTIARLYLPAQLYGSADAALYELTELLVAIKPAAPADIDVIVPFNSQATCTIADVQLVIVS